MYKHRFLSNLSLQCLLLSEDLRREFVYLRLSDIMVIYIKQR